ncbi:MAG: FAD:protein FMN transferase [Akkermansiaceae bacterium]
MKREIQAGESSFQQCKPLLGTYVEISLSGALSKDELFELSLAGFTEIERIQQLMSFHDTESELSRINQSAHLEIIHISQEMLEVLTLALQLSEMSDGLFDLSVGSELVRRGILPSQLERPKQQTRLRDQANWRAIQLEGNQLQFLEPLQLDLGGIAKGYAVDRALSVMSRMKTTTNEAIDIVINAGGDLCMNHWQGRDIEIRTPISGGKSTMKVPMQNQALATSAAYFLEHDQVIINPQSGQPISTDQSISIFASSCMLADAMTKIAALMQDPSHIMQHFSATGLILNLEESVKTL